MNATHLTPPPIVIPVRESEPKAVKINAQVHFGGNSRDKDNIIIWLKSIETNMRYCKVPENSKVECASAHLNDQALRTVDDWFNDPKISKTDQISWLKFCEMMKLRFLPLDHLNTICKTLLQIRQNSTVANYNNKFEELVSQLDPSARNNELFLINTYLNGLQTAVRESIQYLILPTLRENMTRAGLYDSTHPSQRQGNQLPTGVNSMKNSKHNHGKRGNSGNGTRTNDNGNRGENPRPTCTHCNKVGHKIDQCYKLHPDSKPKTNNPTSNVQSNQTKPKFNKNKSDNSANLADVIHSDFAVTTIINDSSNSAATNPKTTSDEFCRIMIEIEGQTLECILDSGARTTVIPTKFATDLALKLKPEKVKCQVANGKIEYTSITFACDVIVCGTITPLEMIVFDRREGLLGLDWLNANHAYVNTYDMTLCFENRKFSIANLNAHEVYHLDHATAIDHNLADFKEDALMVSADDLAEIEQEFDHEPWPLTSEYKSDSDFKILESDNLSTAELLDLNIFINKYKSNFARNISDIKDHCNLSTFKIELTDNVPVSLRPYRVSPFERERINQHVKEMVDAGVIRPSCSPYKSPVVLIPKKGGELRFCIDYRQLNRKTVKDGFPLPLIQDIFDRLKGSRFFTSLDEKAGFWQLQMEIESIAKSSFVTCDGQWEFLVLPFGVVNGPSAFSRIMYMSLGDLDFVEIYLDDILIHSATLEDHYKHVEIVFKRLAEVNLKLNFSKCCWFRKELKFLGHIIAEGIIKTDDFKTEAIREWSTPRNVQQVQQFLGLAGYYRKFVPNFAHIAHPLYHLTKKVKYGNGRLHVSQLSTN